MTQWSSICFVIVRWSGFFDSCFNRSLSSCFISSVLSHNSAWILVNKALNVAMWDVRIVSSTPRTTPSGLGEYCTEVYLLSYHASIPRCLRIEYRPYFTNWVYTKKKPVPHGGSKYTIVHQISLAFFATPLLLLCGTNNPPRHRPVAPLSYREDSTDVTQWSEEYIRDSCFRLKQEHLTEVDSTAPPQYK